MTNPQTLIELLNRRVAHGGVALYDRDRPVTAAQLEDESRRVAQGLYDLGVREGDGLNWWGTHAHTQGKGVIITTARGEGVQRIQGIQAGADVYLVKPIQLEELASLVRNLMRRLRSHILPQWTLKPQNWTLMSPSGMVVKLTHSETVLLQRLSRAPGQAISRQDLVLSLGHDPQSYDYRRMEILVRRLRNKTKELLGGELPVETVRRVGYAFTASMEVA